MLIMIPNKDLKLFWFQVGLALSYAAPIVSLLSSFLTSFTETEKEMVSVERVVEVIDDFMLCLMHSLSVNTEYACSTWTFRKKNSKDQNLCLQGGHPMDRLNLTMLVFNIGHHYQQL